MMHLQHVPILKQKDVSLYYSLELPLIWSFSPKSVRAANKLDDLREIKHVQNSIKNYVQDDKHGLMDSPMYELFTNTEFNFFHSDCDKHQQTLSSSMLPVFDTSLKNELLKYSKKPFNDTSPFSGVVY